MHYPRSFHLEISELDNSCDRHSWKESHATWAHENALKIRIKSHTHSRPGSSVGIETRRMDSPGIESRWRMGARFSSPVQTGFAAH
jgi:hypothetical protein